MHAAQGGNLAIVRALLTAGAPWNALDRQGRCAGEYAMEAAAAAAQPEVFMLEGWGLFPPTGGCVAGAWPLICCLLDGPIAH